MQKNITKIIILTLFSAIFILPFISRANLAPAGCDQGSLYSTETGQSCTDTGSGGGGGGTGNTTSSGPNGYTFCVNENQVCNFTGIKDVAYGVYGKFYYRTNITDSINCNNNTFRDPYANVAKACYIKDSASSSANANTTKSSLFVYTGEALNVTQNTATLNGTGGDLVSKPTLPITAYFRYTKANKNNPPIFCNDVYGSNMISTGDKFLGPTASQSFSQEITGLAPNTTYYYCAIISNKDNIAYGGSSIVKSFHTNCYNTTVETKKEANIKSTSAILNGTYCSPKNNLAKTITNTDVTTYFVYKKSEFASPWIVAKNGNKSSEQKNSLGNYANLFGNINFNLTGLTPNTTYQFRAVVKNNAGTANEATYTGDIFYFTTSASSSGTNSGSGETGNEIKNPVCKLPYVLNSSTNTCIYTPPTTTCENNATNYPACDNIPDNICVNGATNYPKCDTNIKICMNGANNPPTCIKNTNYNNDGTNTGTNTGTTGTWNSGTDSGTWISTSGVGGTGSATWTGTGNGGGVWTSATGSGTWTSNKGTNGIGGGTNTGTWNSSNWRSNNSYNNGNYNNGNYNNGTGSNGNNNNKKIIDTTPLKLGQTATPPSDAIVRYQEGIETVFARQIVADVEFAKKYGYTDGSDLQSFAWYLSDQLARMFGYVNENGREIRVSKPDIAAYQLQLSGNTLKVYEYYDNTIVDVRNVTTTFKEASDYEYYFKKN